ncbi:ABC transporter permease subunit [Proteiniclasticum sp.]|uniref:ABC transporter permease subunit n=1 Tax=Proteiniclasticum sp. TaxID=2053595 RepID=UPI0028A2C933|nr:ABC transporter permease [Proteiniclasticum sp.]
MREKLHKIYDNIGLPRIIIISFFLFMLIIALPLGLNVQSLLGDAIRRWAMYGILVLAMVPAVQSGIGLNFGISLGIVAGLIGATFTIEIGIGNPFLSIFLALSIAIALGSLFGIGYGLLLNRVKGSEMTVSTYVGFSVIAFMNMVWLSLPYKNGDLIWPLGGQGMRNTISLSSSFGHVFNNILDFSFGIKDGAFYATPGDDKFGLYIPTGLILFFLFSCFLVWLFMRSKAGMAMSAAGANEQFTKASGINVNKMRILGTAISTALAAVGIIIYAQSYGFLQLYNAPLMMGFHSVAAVLIGGASIKRAKISHVLIGAFLFQGILAVALPVANKILPEGNLSDVIRIIISNGIILYALSKTKGGAK